MAATPPTFKLVLVGDGGTGKVRLSNHLQNPGRYAGNVHVNSHVFTPLWLHSLITSLERLQQSSLWQLTRFLDHFRQATLDGRVREEVYCNARCRGSPSWIHDSEFESLHMQHLGRTLTLRRTSVRFNSTYGIQQGKRSSVD